MATLVWKPWGDIATNRETQDRGFSKFFASEAKFSPFPQLFARSGFLFGVPRAGGAPGSGTGALRLSGSSVWHLGLDLV